MTNPLLSMWLSAANSWTGAARGYWTAEMHRQQNALAREMMEQCTRFWLEAWQLSTTRPKPKARGH